MKVLINRKPVVGPWGGGNLFVEAFYDYANENGICTLNDLESKPDVIFIFHPNSENGCISFLEALKFKQENPHVKIVVRVNECDARKNTNGVDHIWSTMSSFADHSIFVSRWMKDYFSSSWKCSSNEVIINGVDRTKFSKEEKLSKQNGKINIVCAHWSDNFLKGQEYYEYLEDFTSKNEDYTFTFIGRTKAKIRNLKSAMSPAELVKELSKYDVCVNGTFWDPGPNAVIESIVAGLPTYVHSKSGGAAEFAGSDHVFTDVSDLEKILLSKNFHSNKDEFLSWKEVMKKVFDSLRKL